MKYKRPKSPKYLPITRFTSIHSKRWHVKWIEIPPKSVEDVVKNEFLKKLQDDVKRCGEIKKAFQSWAVDESHEVQVLFADGTIGVFPVSTHSMVYYCPKCVDEQEGCPYYFSPGYCPKHSDTKLIPDEELTNQLRKERIP